MYVPTSQACDEPNSETPLSPSAVSAQDARVAAVGQQFLNGNAAVYDLVASLGGNLPGMVPASPSPAIAPLATVVPVSSAVSVSPTGATSTVGGSTAPASGTAAPVFIAPGVQAAPPDAMTMPPQFIGGVRRPTGAYVGNAIKSMVQGCNPPWATLGGQAPAAPAQPPNAAWMWGLGLLALSAFVVFGSGKDK